MRCHTSATGAAAPNVMWIRLDQARGTSPDA